MLRWKVSFILHILTLNRKAIHLCEFYVDKSHKKSQRCAKKAINIPKMYELSAGIDCAVAVLYSRHKRKESMSFHN